MCMHAVWQTLCQHNWSQNSNTKKKSDSGWFDNKEAHQTTMPILSLVSDIKNGVTSSDLNQLPKKLSL